MVERVLVWLFYSVSNIFRRHAMNDVVKELLKYGLSGVLSNGIGYTVYLLLTYFGVAPKTTMSLLYFTAMSIGFFLNKALTFSYAGSALACGLRYLLAHAAGYLINLAMLIFFVDRLGYAHQVVQAVAIFVVAGFLFLAFKFFVFRPICS